MKGFYDLLEKIKWHFDNDPLVNTITQGSIHDVDLNKQTIFPLVHLMVNSSTLQSNTMKFNVSLISMDIVDESKDEVTDIYRGNNNEIDVLNTQHSILNRAYEMMHRGQLWDELIVIEGEPTLEPFVDRFENLLAGWTMTFDIVMPNDMTICDTSGYSPYCASGFVNILNSSDGLIKSVEVASGAIEDTYINDTAIFARNSNADIVATAVSLGGAVSAEVDIPDTTYDIYLDGVFKESVTLPTLANEDLNIILV
jgi:hypothetical protein